MHDNQFYINRNAKRLETKVAGRNQLNAAINLWFPKIREMLLPWVGQKVSLVTGGKPHKLVKAIQDLQLPNDHNFQIQIRFERYSAQVWFRNCICIKDDTAIYSEQTVYLGDMDGANLKDLHYTFEPWRTNYTVESINAARKALKDAEKAVSDAKSALYPFSEHDNF